MIKVLFENIESELIGLLTTANSTIDIAVSWITNQKIFEVIKAKASAGVNIRLLMINDSTNNHNKGLSYQNLIDIGAKLYVCQGPNLMHNKYCIIDSKVLINGSCNWTNNLDINDENLIVTTDIETCKLYQNNFEVLINKYILLNKFIQSPNERKIQNDFLLVPEEQRANNYDDKQLLELFHKNEEKEFVVLRFLSQKTALGRIYDPPFINDRTRFVSLNRQDINQLEIGDFIIYPSDQKINKSEYLDENGKNQVALWMITPQLNLDSFFKKDTKY